MRNYRQIWQMLVGLLNVNSIRTRLRGYFPSKPRAIEEIGIAPFETDLEASNEQLRAKMAKETA